MTEPEFERLMQTVANGWNEGEARTPALAGGATEAADCFTEEAIYVDPPGKQLYHGRAELYEFFGGDRGTHIPMKMTWHHLAFNEREQIGFGEYTFAMQGRYHGVVVMKVELGLIKHWRGHQYQSEMDWEKFMSHILFSKDCGKKYRCSGSPPSEAGLSCIKSKVVV